MKNQGNDQLNKLANRLKKGDAKAGEELFDYFSVLIFRFFVARTSNREIAEDLTQDVFLKVVSKIGSFNEEVGNFSSWIWQIAKNSLIDYFRSKKEIPLPDDLENFFGAYRIEEEIEDNIRKKEIFEIVKKLNEDEQEVFSLYFLSDLSYREISKITEKSESSLRVLVHRMLQKIKKVING